MNFSIKRGINMVSVMFNQGPTKEISFSLFIKPENGEFETLVTGDQKDIDQLAQNQFSSMKFFDAVGYSEHCFVSQLSDLTEEGKESWKNMMNYRGVLFYFSDEKYVELCQAFVDHSSI